MVEETNRFQSRLENLRDRFITRMHEDRHTIAQAFEKRDYSSMRDISHKLAGIAGSFGFADVGQAAADLQYLLDDQKGDLQITDASYELFRVIDRQKDLTKVAR